MQVVTALDAMRALLAEWRDGGDTVALVPTMGNLHKGHLALAEYAATQADHTVVTVFVNPTQFAAGEDYKTYPRTLDKDTLVLKRTGVEAVFAPQVSEVYPFGQTAATRVHVPEIGDDLCGRHRQGHFDGVASVVCRLLFMVQPDVAVFGEKDYQQLLLLKRMVSDLSIPVRVDSVATVRESDGLALSSRNQYLSAKERAVAPALHAVLTQIVAALAEGNTDFAKLEAGASGHLEEAGFRPDYIAVRDAATLTAPSAATSEAFVVLGAAWLGDARLIDNVRVANPQLAT